MRLTLIVISVLFTACGTHAPMSEMVMFNVKRSSPEDSVAKYTNFGIGLQYANNGPFENEYDEKNEQDYEGVEDSYNESLAISAYWLNDNKFGFGYSLGLANGIDFTMRIYDDYYGTVTTSGNTSIKAIFQKRLFVDEVKGIAAGVYFGRGVQPYYSADRGFVIGPDKSTSLYHAGLRSSMIFRNKNRRGSGFTGSANIGYIFETDEPYIGFSVAFMTF
jgi:hypothetical protein